MPGNKIPDESVLLNNLGKIAYTLDKTYMSNLVDEYSVLISKFNNRDNIRCLKINRWIYDRNENIGDCFKNVISLFADGIHTLAIVIHRTTEAAEMYFVVKKDGSDIDKDLELLDSSIHGNFPGSYTEKNSGDYSFINGAESIAVLANSPSEYSEDHLTQRIDKLLNGIIPSSENESYSVVFLLESISNEMIREILSGYEELASSIYPFLQHQFQLGESSSDTKGETKSITNSNSVTESIFKTHSINFNLNAGYNESNSVTHSEFGKYGRNIGGKLIGYIGDYIGKYIGEMITSTVGRAFGISGGYGYGWGTSRGTTEGTSDSTGTSNSLSIGTSETDTYTHKSFTVANIIHKLESVIKRINESQASGLWKYATYVLAKDTHTAKNVANFLRSLSQGKESYVEPASIQVWNAGKTPGEATNAFDEIIKYVSHFSHPIFFTYNKDATEDASYYDSMFVTPTSYVATDELSHVIAFPRRSLPELPILESAQFGREPHSLITRGMDLELGTIYHMFEVDKNRKKVNISKDDLTKHTFITGSTGSGKSNAIYHILDELTKKDINFLVVEPAKGEYRHAFSGADKKVTVYGTNHKKGRLLKIDPFSFPKDTHILEHLDRLVEIFNVCWPMYAAMPAILKDAVERAYAVAGWNLTTSENICGRRIFPTFADVLSEIKLVLEESDYAADNKGNYTGALVTRLKSLTNGINGQIFSSDAILDKDLFDKNVIVDLSRVGSSETKALIMALIVLKLQEHRMESSKMNQPLRHVTVLEEAHAILKRTNTEQSAEGANLLARSVEMLANSIAEMRTYGEGFIIADQSPGLLDMSVIRNTNTKIIMRLPDITDRELVGRAAGLNDEQIIELGRLEVGVAAVHQNDWIESVLCKIDKYEMSMATHENNPKESTADQDSLRKEILELIVSEISDREGDECGIDQRDLAKRRKEDERDQLLDKISRSNLPTSLRKNLLAFFDAEEKDLCGEIIKKATFDLLNTEEAVDNLKEYNDAATIIEDLAKHTTPPIDMLAERQKHHLLFLILDELHRRHREPQYEHLAGSALDMIDSITSRGVLK